MLLDGVFQTIKKIEAVGCQPIQLLLRKIYCESTKENALSEQSKGITITSTSGGFANPRWKILSMIDKLR